MHATQQSVLESVYLCSLRFGMGDSDPAPLVAGRLIDGIMGTDFPAV